MDRVDANVFRLRKNMHAWNVDASSSDSYTDVSWIRRWEMATGLERGQCSFHDCTRRAEVGGHVWIKENGVYIAPICSSCNYHANAERMQSAEGDHSFLRKGVVVLKTTFTEDMRHANRRIAVYEQADLPRRSRHGRRCEECRDDITDRPENHILCFTCYRTQSVGRGRGARRRRCADCAGDISDRPEHHAHCWVCFTLDHN